MLKKIVSFSVLVFGLLACSEDVKNVKNLKAKVDHELKTNKRTNDNLKIAFYHQDSMKLYFQYYKEQDSIFTKKNIDFQNKVAAKRKSMESYYMNFMRRAQNNELSQVESEAYQRNLQNQEAELIQFQETVGGKLEQETLRKYDEISKKINNFSTRFCEEKGIDILLVQAEGGQFNYISDQLDVTDVFVDFLNESQLAIENELNK
jgi:hypothetical protein